MSMFGFLRHCHKNCGVVCVLLCYNVIKCLINESLSKLNLMKMAKVSNENAEYKNSTVKEKALNE